MSAPEAISVDGPNGRLFAILQRPPQNVPVRGAILHVPAFAEEMNKSRRMVALMAGVLADQGWWVLRPDLSGCGDSVGEFSQASWRGWVDDLASAERWIAEASGRQPVIWAMRAGCLLGAALVERLATPRKLLFWQPVANGKLHLQQFLRLKVAGGMMQAGGATASTASLLKQLEEGKTVEVAGYELAPAVALGLERAELRPGAGGGSVWCFEVSNAEEATLSMPIRRTAEAWQAAGWQFHGAALRGPAFWQTQEIEEAPELLRATGEAFSGIGAD